MMSAAHAQTGMTFELYDITRRQTATSDTLHWFVNIDRCRFKTYNTIHETLIHNYNDALFVNIDGSQWQSHV